MGEGRGGQQQDWRHHELNWEAIERKFGPAPVAAPDQFMRLGAAQSALQRRGLVEFLAYRPVPALTYDNKLRAVRSPNGPYGVTVESVEAEQARRAQATAGSKLFDIARRIGFSFLTGLTDK